MFSRDSEPTTAETLSKLKVASSSNQTLPVRGGRITIAGLPVLTAPVAFSVDASQIRFVLRKGTTVERFPSVTNDGQFVRAIARAGFAFLNPAGVVRSSTPAKP